LFLPPGNDIIGINRQIKERRTAVAYFVNFTNHDSDRWSETQRREARKYGEIVDLPFPHLSPAADEADVRRTAGECAAKILALNPAAVLCQGEFSLCHALVNLLMQEGVTVMCACSEREVEEKILPDGSTEKTTRFEFQRFRKYLSFAPAPTRADIMEERNG
jgi:hypothetical protein